MADQDIDLLTFTETMKVLKISRKKLYRFLNSGALPGHKCGVEWRFYRNDVERLVHPVANPCIRI